MYAASDLDPAGAAVFAQPRVVDEPTPAVFAPARRDQVTWPERDTAADTKAAGGPVIAGGERQFADTIAIERDDDTATVKAVIPLHHGAVALEHVIAGVHTPVLGLDQLLRLAETDVANPVPRNEQRGVCDGQGWSDRAARTREQHQADGGDQ